MASMYTIQHYQHMKSKSKRKRSVNWTEAETQLLWSEVRKNFSLFSDPVSNDITNKTKEAQWKAIAEKVCALGVANRKWFEVRKKWWQQQQETKLARSGFKRPRNGGRMLDPDILCNMKAADSLIFGGTSTKEGSESDTGIQETENATLPMQHVDSPRLHDEDSSWQEEHAACASSVEVPGDIQDLLTSMIRQRNKSSVSSPPATPASNTSSGKPSQKADLLVTQAVKQASTAFPFNHCSSRKAPSQRTPPRRSGCGMGTIASVNRDSLLAEVAKTVKTLRKEMLARNKSMLKMEREKHALEMKILRKQLAKENLQMLLARKMLTAPHVNTCPHIGMPGFSVPP